MWKSVRAKEGGGIRRLSVKKSSLLEDLMPLAKNLFFPNGVSMIGPISDFSSEIGDFRQEILEDGCQSADEIPLPHPFTFFESEVEVESIPTAVWDVSFTEEASDGEISSSSSRIISFRSEHNMDDCRLESDILDDTVPYEVDNASTSEEKSDNEAS
ncbi:hypothetical protein HOLleu_00759 [Holothuria leucospilota]|uniref:Uncharacterized protein n=1 Tax=Holothuria leucospilota TaxID=206669 RepID=A0A9Q1CQ32_HOLLE|nr:hypothetical protein HOLleu_00759 [Holothuria leucospilota]